MYDRYPKSVDVYALNNFVTYGLFGDIDLDVIVRLPHLRSFVFKNVGKLSEPVEVLRDRIRDLLMDARLALNAVGKKFVSNARIEDGKFDLEIFIC